ncbi:MAG: leucine--tRNA ligase [Spirochaetes bacterium]|nr:leucine--tRNA ligase [Spirochaetota bacterium]
MNDKKINYNHLEIEKKWQDFWDKDKTFEVKEDLKYPKEKRIYILDMFPYPSGEGLHVGHPEGYTATDIIAKYYKLNGYNVLHPMGWDAFGLPAENYAIKNKVHPAIVTDKNIENFKRQIKMIGLGYDWSREIKTTDPEYYKWTQWIFIQLLKNDLAYKTEAPINFCPSCKTGISNEEVVDGKCERCGTEVYRKNLPQWILRITKYADRLLEDLDELDWPEDIKLMQRNWIGRSEGAYIKFKIFGYDDYIEVYTTRPDTIFGVTFMVIAPEHPLVDKITTNDQRDEVKKYKEYAAKKSDLERTSLNKEKTGCFTGAYAINPANDKKIPIYISDYILLTYGTGAIMAVPGHDSRDFEFAKKFNLPIIQVVAKEKGKLIDNLEEAFEEEGYAINSGQFDGMDTSTFKKEIIKFLEEKGIGKKGVSYKLRDWIFSRQRYWGEPIPVVICDKCGIVPLNEDQLPLVLPDIKEYEPSGTGESPLVNIDWWINTECPKCGKPAKRESNTMPQWAGSCWYYLRYLDPKNNKELCSLEKQKYWMPVSLYVGGKEHAVLHLLYARFWHKFLYDIGVVNTKEPFLKLRNQGIILGEDNQKMSKSRGNVVNPDDIIKEYGADTFRMYEMFMGPLETSKPWNKNSIKGVRRFIERVFNYFVTVEVYEGEEKDNELLKVAHKSIKKVTEDILTISAFNTAISQLMVFLNKLEEKPKISKDIAKIYLILLSPFAPHLAEELYNYLGYENSIFNNEKWPQYNSNLIKDEIIPIVITVNGKKRAVIEVPFDSDESYVLELAFKEENILKYVSRDNVLKSVFVKNKLLNLITK